MRLVVALAVLAPAGACAQGGPAALTEATVVEREGALEVWVRLTRTARYQAELMDGPFRLVLDFDNTLYRWTSKPVPITLDPVRALRGSQFRAGVARLVIELRRKVAYTIEQDREGLRIVLARDTPASAGAPRRPAAAAAPAAPPSLPTTPLVYGIVMLDDEAHAYIFDPSVRQVRRYKVGDTVGDAVVETIAERHVILKTPTGRLELRVDDRKPDAPRR